MLEYNVDDFPDFNYLASQLTGDLPTVVKAMASYDRSRFAQNISKGVNPYGDIQTPLKPGYAVLKALKVGNKPILVRSPKGMISTYFQVIGRSGYRVGFRSPVAAYHQRGNKNLPQRLLLPTQERGLTPDQQNKLLNLVSEYLERATRRSRRR